MNFYPSAKACAFLQPFLKKKNRKLGIKFQGKDPIKNQHELDLTYYSKYPEPTYNEGYLSKTGRRIVERTAGRCRKYKKSHLFKHMVTSNHLTVEVYCGT